MYAALGRSFGWSVPLAGGERAAAGGAGGALGEPQLLQRPGQGWTGLPPDLHKETIMQQSALMDFVQKLWPPDDIRTIINSRSKQCWSLKESSVGNLTTFDIDLFFFDF